MTKPPASDTAKLEGVRVTAPRVNEARVTALQSLTLPATVNITAQKIQQTVNIIDVEDAVKYLPSIFLRKRNYGDTQATMATRVWGVGSSARSLVFADGVPLTALVANNNTIGGPRWGLISPVEIARIDMMYGPYSAAYAGNSIGAVMEITTRLPEKLEGSIEQTQALQNFDLYGTTKTYSTAQTSATVGDRFGKFSFWASGNYQDSHSQPLSYVTAGAFPTGTSGGFSAQNKLGAAANVLGASGLLHTGMTNGKIKLAYDLTPILRAAYTFGYWKNDANSGVDTYIDKASEPTFAGQAGFASGFYHLLEEHSAHSLSLRTNTNRDWDFEAIGSVYRFDKDQQRTPTTTPATGTDFTGAGRVAVLDGTGWSTLDLKGTWHPGSVVSRNIVTAGVHFDRYHLNNPTYNTADWRTNGAYTGVATEGDGNTRTQAIWAQDSWRIVPSLQLTVGGRYEDWRAFDGFNANGTTTVTQPTVTSSKFSPKAVIAWTATPQWVFTGSLAKAYRFATASELYQLVSTGTTFTSPDPNLKPDNDLSAELRAERKFEHGTAQVVLFQDDVHDAIIAQFLPLVPNSTTLFSYVSNVDHVRARGVELNVGMNDLLVRGLDISATGTYLDARTLALSGRANATAPAGSAVGKFLPNIPARRAAFTTTYHPGQHWSFSFAGRYNGKMYTTLDNADVNPNTYQGFSEWFVADARVNYRLDGHWSAALGADNLFDRKYFLFHPFPQRTIVANLKFGM
ncbi:MAG TPA: TonB-dependent receptor [Gemmatimonadaceae bacterium]|nr:TonB-dependent receptor [Gemmatimonadaceae bacterium]